MKQEEIKDFLDDSLYLDKLTNRKFYLLTEFVKNYKMCSFKDCVEIMNEVNTKLDKVSLPFTSFMGLSRTCSGEIIEIRLNSVGFMFFLAELSERLTNKADVEFCHEVAYFLSKNYRHYPILRAEARLNYTETTKNLRGKIKFILENKKYSVDLKNKLSLLYYTIINTYYGVTTKEELNRLKAANPKGNYLDHISLRELYDLTEIQRRIYQALDYPNINILKFAEKTARDFKNNFFVNYAKKYPINYQPHFNKPARMLKDYDKLLKEYDLLEINTNIEDETR